MHTRSLSLSRLFPLVCVTALSFGCSDDTTATDDASETTAMSGSETQSNPETSGSMDTSTTANPTTSGDENTFIADEGPDTGEGGAGNLGDQCMSDSDCAEDLACNGIPGFGGVCSECSSDSDCAEGNCTFLGTYFGCGDGGVGQQCESDAVCGDDLFCAEVVNLGGLLNGNFCSECKTDSDCEAGLLCAPQLEFMGIMDFSGQRACIEPGSAPDNQICDVNGAGDEQCENFCTAADIMGLITIGLCGACESDSDCGDGQTCAPAVIGFDGFSGSICM
jgi:hypothetical protein